MIHKVIITKEAGVINDYLDRGWLVKSVTSQRIQLESQSTFSKTETAAFCFVLKKSDL